LSDRISELLIYKTDLLKVYVHPLLVHNSICVIRSSHSSTRTLHMCLNSYYSYFSFIPKLKCDQSITHFSHRYTF